MDLFEEEENQGSNVPEFTVGELAGRVRRILEGELDWIRVRGEVGRVVKGRTGHLYFDLKDDKNVLSCMTWAGQVRMLDVLPEEGMEVVVEGKMTASGMQSRYGLNVQRISIAGEGALMAMLEKRKKALAAEGLFAEERKKPLPYLPEIIGVVTSPQGVVIRDILHRLRDRFPRKVLLWPVAVQGKTSADEVSRAIAGFNNLSPGGAMPRPDLIIVARGGGSIEDLWGFNEEVVARAAAASVIPLISAVGHETDTTLIDYVADRRAPTPTAAAEIAVPVRAELAAWIADQGARLSRGTSQTLQRRRQRLIDLSRALPRPDALLSDPRLRFDRADERLARALSRAIDRKKATLSTLAAGVRPAPIRARVSQDRARLADWSARLAPGLFAAIARKSDGTHALAARLRAVPVKGRLTQERDALERLETRQTAAVSSDLKARAEQVAGLDRLCRSLGYTATLARGYAVVRSGDSVVTDADSARLAGALEIEFKDGRVSAQAGGSATQKPSGKRPKPPEQGSLF